MESRKSKKSKPHHSKIRVFHSVAPIRIIGVNETPQLNVDIYLDCKLLISNLGFQELTGYLKVSSCSKLISIRSSLNGTLLLKSSINLKSHSSFTLVCAGRAEDLKSLVLLEYEDERAPSIPGTAMIRFIDVNSYITFANLGLAKSNDDANVLYENVKYKEVGIPYYIQIPVNSYIVFSDTTTVYFDKNGQEQKEVRVIEKNENFVSGGIYTVILSGFEMPTLTISHDNPWKSDKLKNDFNVQAYMGKWYQIADIPQPFALGCSRSTATYTLLSDRVKVYNICYDQIWKEIRSILGFAKANNQLYPSALTVQFPQIPNLYEPNYLVHYTDYCSYSVVGSPNRTNLYILCRTPKMEEKQYNRLLKKVAKLGYDLNKLKVNYDAIKS